ncbi:MAG: response regulator transcription factor [Acidobacteria bacterium]|nr:response regulator transcription factor [Acidobacteriota bacterium]
MTADRALELVMAEPWDLAIVDVSLGGRSGLDAVMDMKRARPALPVLMLSMHSEELYARRALKAGASGYVMKDSPRAVLLQAINKVLSGGRYVSPSLAESLAFDLPAGTDRPLHEKLSAREFEVLRLIGSGKSVGDISTLLGLSDKTVSTYRSRILEKMSMTSNAELIRYWIEQRL